MRIWSLHPQYLDAKGLVALWRETLLARKVLKGQTKGYRNHPQLERFKAQPNAVNAVDFYLQIVHEESVRRRYKFDGSKFRTGLSVKQIPLQRGQLQYERQHLLRKLKIRDPQMFEHVNQVEGLKLHPLFMLVDGGVEKWEIVQSGD